MRRACAFRRPARSARRRAGCGAQRGARRRRHRAVVGRGRRPPPRHRAPLPAAGHRPHRAAVPGAAAAVGRRAGRGRVRLGSGGESATASPGCCSSTSSRGWRQAARRGPPGRPGPATTCSIRKPTCGWRSPGCAAPCAPSRAISLENGKPASALDAMLVCHVAGCGRVTGSASGVPRAGEAGCDERCAAVVTRYLDAVHGSSGSTRPAARRPGPYRPSRPPQRRTRHPLTGSRSLRGSPPHRSTSKTNRNQ